MGDYHRTGCEFCKSASPLGVVGENGGRSVSATFLLDHLLPSPHEGLDGPAAIRQRHAWRPSVLW